MAGILDSFGSDELDPKTMGLLSMGLRLMSTPGGFASALGKSGMGALGDYQQAKQGQNQAQIQAMQMQQHQMQLKQMEQQMADQARSRDFIQNLQDPMQQASQAALAGGGGPTVANAASAKIDPMQQMLFGGVKAGAVPLQTYLQAMQKDETPITLAEGAKLINRSGKEIASNPKPADLPSAIKEYNFAVSHGYKGPFTDWMLAQKKAGASNVRVSMDKGFGDAFAKNAAESLNASKAKAQSAASSLRTLDQIDGALSSGNVITGPAANAQLALAQVGSVLGVGGKDTTEKLANTRALMQGSAKLAVDGAQALAGQGQITDKERELVNKMAGGNIDNMTVPEIRSTMKVLRKVNTLAIQQHQSALKNVGPEFQKFSPFYQVDAPQQQVVDFGSLK